MADFDDTTGWFEDYHALEASEAWETEWARRRQLVAEGKHPKLFPLSRALQIAELMLGDPKVGAAWRVIRQFEIENPDMPPDEYVEKSPGDEYRVLSDFIVWFLWKTDFPDAYHFVYPAIMYLHSMLRRGEIEDVHAPEAIAYLRRSVGKFIDFDN